MVAVVDTKKCTKCGEVKSVDCFCINNQSKDGFNSRCKQCVNEYYQENKERLQVKSRENYKNNREDRLITNREYHNNNKDAINEQQKVWRSNNKDAINEYNRNYREKHREKLKIHARKYYIDNKEEIKHKDRIRAKKRLNQFSKSELLIKQLPISDKPEFDSKGYITVVCKYCDERFRTVVSDIMRRISCVKGIMSGESNFYCKEECKDVCPLYNFKTDRMTDPRSKLAIPKTDQEEARRCQTDHLKILQMDEFGYNFCEKCGAEVDTVELHHTLPVAQFGLEAINSAGHLLVCNDCHKEFTKECMI